MSSTEADELTLVRAALRSTPCFWHPSRYSDLLERLDFFACQRTPCRQVEVELRTTVGR